jgi:multiple sugar transport system permease protein
MARGGVRAAPPRTITGDVVAADSATVRQPRRRIGEDRRQEALAGYGLIAIPMILFLIFQIGSIFFAIYISLWKWGPLGPTGINPFRGLRNYQTILGDPIFWKAVTNTLYYTVIWVPLTMAIGLFLAVVVNQKLRGQTFFRAAFYFPAIASSAAITTLFIFIMGPDGLFNGVREAIGINPLFQLLGFGPNYNWLGESRTAMNSIIILNAWTTSGTFMLFYLASLQSISHEVYEAAAIDGASAWQTFWKVTFPLLRPGHYFVATVAVIGGLQLFDQAIFAGGQGGEPNNSLTTMVLFLYRSAISDFNFGYAAAVGVILLVVIMAATLIQRRLFGQAPSW